MEQYRIIENNNTEIRKQIEIRNTNNDTITKQYLAKTNNEEITRQRQVIKNNNDVIAFQEQRIEDNKIKIAEQEQRICDNGVVLNNQALAINDNTQEIMAQKYKTQVLQQNNTALQEQANALCVATIMKERKVEEGATDLTYSDTIEGFSSVDMYLALYENEVIKGEPIYDEYGNLVQVSINGIALDFTEYMTTLLNGINKRNIKVLGYRYIEKETLEEITRRIGVTKQRVQQLLISLHHKLQTREQHYGATYDMFSTRTENVLRQNGITTDEQLCALCVEDLMKMRNCGKRVITEIACYLQEKYNVTLRYKDGTSYLVREYYKKD